MVRYGPRREGAVARGGVRSGASATRAVTVPDDPCARGALPYCPTSGSRTHRALCVGNARERGSTRVGCALHRGAHVQPANAAPCVRGARRHWAALPAEHRARPARPRRWTPAPRRPTPHLAAWSRSAGRPRCPGRWSGRRWRWRLARPRGGARQLVNVASGRGRRVAGSSHGRVRWSRRRSTPPDASPTPRGAGVRAWSTSRRSTSAPRPATRGRALAGGVPLYPGARGRWGQLQPHSQRAPPGATQ